MGNATVTLGITGRQLDPDAVSSAMGVIPTSSRRACDPRLRRTLGDAAWELGRWEIRRQDVPIEDIEDVVKEFAALFDRGNAALAAIGELEWRISIGLFQLRGTGDRFFLAPALLRTLGECGLGLSIDAYGQSVSTTASA